MKLRTKMMGSVVLLSAFIGGIFVVFSVLQRMSHEEARLADKIRHNHQLVGNVATRPLFNVDLPMLELALKSFLLDPEVVAISVSDPSGLLPEMRFTEETGTGLDRHLFEEEIRIEHRGEWLGTVRMTYSRHEIESRIRESVYQMILLLGVLLMTTVGVLLWLLRRIATPISRLSDETLEIARGGLDTEIDIHGNDEIGILANNFRQMQTAIREKIDSLVQENAIRLQAEEELRKNQKVLRESEAFRKQVFDSSRMPIVIMDGTSYRYLDCNDAAVSAYGYESKDAVLGLTPLEVSAPLQYDGTPSPEKATAYLQQAAAEGSVIFEWKHQRRDGTQWDAEVHLINFAFGETRMFQFSLVDITERKRAEDLIRHANEELEHRVRERTKELQTSNEMLQASGEELQAANQELQTTIEYLNEVRGKMIEQEKMASLGGLVAGVAHEVNTPLGSALTAISFLAPLLEELHAKLGTNELRRTDLATFLDSAGEAVKLALHNLNRAAELVASFKKISVEQSADQFLEFDLGVCIHDILLSLRHEYKNKSIRIDTECPEPGALILHNYPGAFVQILTNLIMNSIRHGLKDTPDGIIRITVRQTEDRVTLFYSDNGCGMTEEVRARAFDPFFTTARGEGGTGLGLSIVYNLVTQRMRGTLDLKTAPGEGVQFTIGIPINITAA